MYRESYLSQAFWSLCDEVASPVLIPETRVFWLVEV